VARARVKVFAVPAYDRKKHGDTLPKAKPLDPNPVAAVDGKWTSDEARRNVQTELAAKGYKVRSVNTSPEKCLIAYVEEKKPKKRKPRSAKGKKS
jgi:hypothetical protein